MKMIFPPQLYALHRGTSLEGPYDKPLTMWDISWDCPKETPLSKLITQENNQSSFR